ncbi:bifunctional 3'-5' exonuclease/DNA polymerase [Cellulomonas triticagri]|uniref:DNA-directed DNA polymerase n=1 Tax=Cellulomonas triticagri TaxID=2483352 RepID=A0A3M2JNR8_9CELL|nr:bifunctional 3'-5' exonuclease/DNA polymerase [Cellulomonas triticagri]
MCCVPHVLVAADPERPGGVVLREAADAAAAAAGDLGPEQRVGLADLPGVVAERESRDAADPPRWVWEDTERWYPDLLTAGVRVRRAHDLRLAHTVLRRSTRTAATTLARSPEGPWDLLAPATHPDEPEVAEPSLFDDLPDDAPPESVPVLDVAAELARQLRALTEAGDDGRLRLLVAAESVGALIAAEMRHDGLPFRTDVHDALLTGLLGPRPARDGDRPDRLAALAERIGAALDRPGVNPDSQPDLLRALRAAGVDVASTRTAEIRAVDHPVRDPLLEYKKLARLLSANGWVWMDRWVQHGRFRPDYVPAGVVTGRWASSGGGALQLPSVIRDAVRADPGWRLVVADAAQLEPRVLAAMSGDGAMAAAGRQADLYAGVVAAGIVPDRQHAKYAMLGAIYGATTGASAALMPQLARAYPRAVALVEEAARAGERGEQVTTWLGRSSPLPGAAWLAARQAASAEGAAPEDARDARRRSRDWGRFTRNFVVQGTAAEWALCWMAVLRTRLADVPGGAHLVFFLHDEVMVHAPAPVADEVATIVREAAVEAGRLLFGDTPVEFALDVSVVDSYADAV